MVIDSAGVAGSLVVPAWLPVTPAVLAVSAIAAAWLVGVIVVLATIDPPIGPVKAPNGATTETLTTRTGTRDRCCWAGAHSSDPTSVTVLDLARSCGHTMVSDRGVPTCARHAGLVAGPAAHPTVCPACGERSALSVIKRHPAR